VNQSLKQLKKVEAGRAVGSGERTLKTEQCTEKIKCKKTLTGKIIIFFCKSKRKRDFKVDV
jgi:hypothetical protein